MRLSEAFLISGKEIREILRDRRALFFAFVLPLLLYPVLFFGAARLEDLREAAAATGPSRVGVAGSSGSLHASLGRDPDLEIVPLEPDWSRLEREEIDALLIFSTAEPEKPVFVTAYYVGSTPRSQEAIRRLERTLRALQAELLEARFQARGAPLDPDRQVSVAFRDLADPAERAGAILGKLLPFILVALLLTGGAFAAIDLIAGEKERGTLETLFIQPVESGGVVLGKFLAVLATSLTAVVLNLLGMALALALGLGPPGVEATSLLLPHRAAAAMALVVPLAVLTSAALLAISAHARSFREAQLFLLPVTLLGMLPALLAVLPEVRLSPALAMIPVANTALAIREALLGECRWGYLAATFGSTSLYAGLVLGWASGLLGREDLRLPRESTLASSEASARARRGLSFGALMVILVAYAGTLLQRPDGPLGLWGGLAITLWAFVLIPPLLYLRLFRLPVRETLALRAPRPRDLLAAFLLVPPAAVLVLAYMTFQDSVLPFPEGLREELERVFAPQGLHPVLAALLIAVSPAICEEVLWRGVVQGELEAEGRPVKTVLCVAILFGLFHIDAYRLAPAALLGALLAYLRLSTSSIIPCALFHGLYNGVMVFGMRAGGDGLTVWVARTEVALPAAALLLGLVWWIRPARR